MYYFFYKTTNLINGKIYYGVHKTKDLNDSYLGSGSAIKNAIKKYGKDNFKREIIKLFNSSEEMYSYEREFITEDIVKDSNTYNETLGGRGGFSHIDNYGDNNPMKDPEIARKCVESARNSGKINSEAKRVAARNNFKIASKNNIGKKRPEHSEFMKIQGKKNWENNKETMRDALASYFCLLSPDGVKYRTNRLEDFCKVNDLPYTTIWGISVSGKIPIKGKAKGWYCEKE